MATTEEFTFPVISTDTCPSSIDSPPLWRLSPAASPDPHHERRGKHNEEQEGYCYGAKPKGSMQRKSCSDIEDREHDDDDEEEEEEEEEEKMDVLWEDFNEELYRGKSSSLEGGYKNKSSSSRDMAQVGCVQALKLSSSKASNNNNGAIFSSSSSPKHSNNKPAVVVFIKVLKRLFLLHNSHHHHQHHHHHRHKSVTVRNMKW